MPPTDTLYNKTSEPFRKSVCQKWALVFVASDWPTLVSPWLEKTLELANQILCPNVLDPPCLRQVTTNKKIDQLVEEIILEGWWRLLFYVFCNEILNLLAVKMKSESNIL